MLHRALFWLLAAVLVLAFALPAPGAAAVSYGAAIERGADGGPCSLASITFHPNDRATAFSPWSEPDDEDRNFHTVEVLDWPPVASSVSSCRTSDVLRCTYSTSAAFPRGPPSA